MSAAGTGGGAAQAAAARRVHWSTGPGGGRWRSSARSTACTAWPRWARCASAAPSYRTSSCAPSASPRRRHHRRRRYHGYQLVHGWRFTLSAGGRGRLDQPRGAAAAECHRAVRLWELGGHGNSRPRFPDPPGSDGALHILVAEQ